MIPGGTEITTLEDEIKDKYEVCVAGAARIGSGYGEGEPRRHIMQALVHMLELGFHMGADAMNVEIQNELEKVRKEWGLQ
jgi:hypothetical protein